MKFFNWMQNKFNGGSQGNNKHTEVPAKNHIKKEPPNEEFSDLPHGLLTIGTFGNTNLPPDDSNKEIQVDPSPDSSPDFSEFTTEEVGKLQKELTKLLRRKPAASKPEEPVADLPLDRFLNCPSSLEVDRTISNRFSTHSDEEEIDRTIRIILGKCKDVCEKKKKSIGKKSLSFLFKKMFVCSSGFAPTPNLRDSFQESRMEKLLRTMLAKKLNRQNSHKASSSKKYLEDNKEKEDESHDKSDERSKWDKTDSEYIVLEI